MSGLVIAALSMSHASPQELKAPARSLQYDVSVVLKLIHVYVTDKKGNPVPDLAMSDFVDHRQRPARESHGL